MTSTSPTPTLLPGVPASAWARNTTVAAYLTIPAYLGFALLRVFANDPETFNRWFLPIVTYGGIALVAALVFGAIFASRAKREVAAGYTTLWRGNSTVPQLNAKTGEVLRNAGDPYIKKLGTRSVSPADFLTPVAAPMSRPSRWIALRSFWYFPLIAAVATLGFFARVGWLNAQGFAWLPVGFVSFLAFVALIFVVVGLVSRPRLAELRAMAPGGLVFLFARSPTLWSALKKAGWTLGELPLATGLGASADVAGITVWRTGPATRGVTVPWASVVSIQADSIVTGNQSRPGVLINLKNPDGDLVALPMANSNTDSFPIVSKPGVNYLVAQLNQMRAGNSTVRLI
jgi:hypothetical protein